jgi:hypothetical protein
MRREETEPQKNLAILIIAGPTNGKTIDVQ